MMHPPHVNVLVVVVPLVLVPDTIVVLVSEQEGRDEVLSDVPRRPGD